MAKATSSKPIDPFASAKKAVGTSKGTPKKGVYVATSPVESQAIIDYCEGKKFEDQGKAMKETARPQVMALAMSNFIADWLTTRKRPDNPAVASGIGADARYININFVDKPVMLNDESFAQLANLIGAQAAEDNTFKADIFSLNADLMEVEADVTINGKPAKMRVMDAIGAALQQVFAPSPAVLSGLFSVKQVFTTVKGLIDKGPNLVAPDASNISKAKMKEFLEIAAATPQVKPGAMGT